VAYNVLDLTSAVQDDLGDSSFSTTRILRYLNRGQQLIFNTHLFDFTEKSVVGNLTTGEYTYDQQDDHQSTLGGSVIDSNDTSRRMYIDEESYLESDVFFERFPDPSLETSSFPTFWTEFGRQVYFNCPVDSTYSFTMRYYRFPTELTDNTSVPEVPESFRELLEYYAIYRSEKYRGNHDVAMTYKQDFEDGLESMVVRYTGNSVAAYTMKQTRVRVDA
jgi:hypothetical protein